MESQETLGAAAPAEHDTGLTITMTFIALFSGV
jgi:hypothetical protein